MPPARWIRSTSTMTAGRRGLATVYGIVKQSEGFIWAAGAPGGGTIFRIYFPRLTETSAARSASIVPFPATKEVAQMTKTLADCLRRRALL
jgi:hypothetical protein